jgi:XisH protein
MPVRDIYHNAVKSALIKDGWIITADPYRIKYQDIDLYADLAAEQPMAAERQGQKIIVEIKSFVGRSLMTDFHQAVGQYMVYRILLEKTAPEYRLYLAIDDITHISFFKRAGMEFLVQASQIDLLVVDVDRQEIVEWIS